MSLEHLRRIAIEWDSGDPDIFAAFFVAAFSPATVKLLLHPFAALEGHDRGLLEKKITQLKQSDGEGWAVGELLERALATLAELGDSK